MAEHTPDGLPPGKWPGGPSEPQVISVVRETSDRVVLKLNIEADCPWFEGHFPGQPVLPGVIQLRWALQLARLAWPDLGTVSIVSNLKFQKPVLPPAQLRLVLQRHHQTGRLDFSWYQGEIRCATGRAGFG